MESMNLSEQERSEEMEVVFSQLLFPRNSHETKPGYCA